MELYRRNFAPDFRRQDLRLYVGSMVGGGGVGGTARHQRDETRLVRKNEGKIAAGL